MLFRNNNMSWWKRITLCVSCLVIFPLFESDAFAFKPITHVFLAERCVDDALDGTVEIYEVDYSAGKIKRDASGNPKLIGRYRVRADLLRALRQFPDHYRAGVLGPDAYPDIVTGQQVIHPAGAKTDGETSIDLNEGGPGPDAWLAELWNAAYAAPGSEELWREKAFVAGYLTHAAGDMFAHTYVNYYTGGAFHFTPKPENAIKHIILEGYIQYRTPDPTFRASIDGIEGFITTHMVAGRPGTKLYESLLTGKGSSRSIPAQFSRLRAKLDREIEEWDKLGKKPSNRDLILNPKLQVKWAKESAEKEAKRPLVMYLKAWRKDIDDGLNAWPEVSHRLALALFFNPERTENWDEVELVLRGKNGKGGYVTNHLLSMMGAPDVVGSAANLSLGAEDLVKSLTEQLQLPIDAIKKNLIDVLLQQSTGHGSDFFKDMAKSPELRFDVVLDNPEFFQEGGHRIKRVDFDSRELHIDGSKVNEKEPFDYMKFPPAYNTTVMTKLLFMEPSEVNRLMQDLMRDRGGTSRKLDQPNAMLGFVETLDGSNQWWVNKNKKMVVAWEAQAYRQIFMLQKGESTGGDQAEASDVTSGHSRPDHIIIPNLLGKSGRSAVAELHSLSLKFRSAAGQIYADDEVVETVPAAKRVVRPGDYVLLRVMRRTPDLIGKTFKAAENEASTRGLKAKPTIVGLTPLTDDRVEQQQPEPGKLVEPSGTIYLRLSRKVPPVVAKSVADAVKELHTAEFAAVHIPSPTPFDTVLEQSPKGGESAAVDSEVTLVVRRPVPDVTNKTIIEARRELKDHGFGLHNPKDFDRPFPVWVLSQDLPAKKILQLEPQFDLAKVVVTLKPGVKVRSVIGASPEIAERLLRDQGLKAIIEGDQAANGDIRVKSQDPTADTLVDIDRTIRLTVVRVTSVIPALKGLPVVEAKKQLQREKLAWKFEPSEVESDSVYDQEPDAGTKYSLDKSVKLVPGYRTVELMNRPLAEAQEEMRKVAGALDVRTIEADTSDRAKDGAVIVTDQTTPPGQIVKRGDKSQITVTRYKFVEPLFAVPEFRGHNELDADLMASNAGLRLRKTQIERRSRNPEEIGKKLVTDQNVHPPARVSRGDLIALELTTFIKAPEPAVVSVPDFYGKTRQQVQAIGAGLTIYSYFVSAPTDDPQYIGKELATDQTPLARTPVNVGDHVTVTFTQYVKQAHDTDHTNPPPSSPLLLMYSSPVLFQVQNKWICIHACGMTSDRSEVILECLEGASKQSQNSLNFASARHSANSDTLLGNKKYLAYQVEQGSLSGLLFRLPEDGNGVVWYWHHQSRRWINIDPFETLFAVSTVPMNVTAFHESKDYVLQVTGGAGSQLTVLHRRGTQTFKVYDATFMDAIARDKLLYSRYKVKRYFKEELPPEAVVRAIDEGRYELLFPAGGNGPLYFSLDNWLSVIPEGAVTSNPPRP